MRYLGDEWFDALERAAVGVEVDRPADAPRVVVQTVVTDGGDGDTAFHLVLDGSRLSIARGQAHDATVTFTQSLDTARQVASGERSAQEAFMAGEVRVGGDVTVLIEHREALSAFDQVMASVAAATDYGVETGR